MVSQSVGVVSQSAGVINQSLGVVNQSVGVVSQPVGVASQAVKDLMAVENYKTALNTYCQQNRLAPPIYECTYPEDEVGYIVIIKVEGRAFKSTPQGTKRAAESMAASIAMDRLGISLSTGGSGSEGNGSVYGGALNRPPQLSGKGCLLLELKFINSCLSLCSSLILS